MEAYIKYYFIFILVVCPISINFSQSFELGGHERNLSLWGVTKLRNEIYILLDARDGVLSRIRGFNDRYPFRLQTEIKAEEINGPTDIGSSEKEIVFTSTTSKRNASGR